MSKYSIEDIEIFITTHNRSNYLKESITSIINQSENVRKITILDNESTDNTMEVVLSFKKYGVSYIKTEGHLGNFKKIQEIASKPYVMLFHDDDLLHYDYLKLAVGSLNKYSDISLITSRYTEFKDNNTPIFATKITSDHYLFENQQSFAKHMFFIEHIAYATAIYKTEFFKKEPLNYEKYNKFNDWPFMLNFANYGKVALFHDPNIFFIRRHCNQDTWTDTNTPNVEQIINWNLCFQKAIITTFPLSLTNIAFRLKTGIFLAGKYFLFLSDDSRRQYSLKNVFKLSNKLGMISFNFMPLYNKENCLIKKFMHFYLLFYCILIRKKCYFKNL
jgi:glycosyltransferase involved in cell wall biosynthesis